MRPFTTFFDATDTDANGIHVRRSARPTSSAARHVVANAAAARAGVADAAAVADRASQTLASAANHALLVRPVRPTSP